MGGDAGLEEVPDLGIVLEQCDAPAQRGGGSGGGGGTIRHGGGASLVQAPSFAPPIFMG
ncbi:hypothetical protein D3C86_2104180 [compost metagenome]